MPLAKLCFLASAKTPWNWKGLWIFWGKKWRWTLLSIWTKIYVYWWVETGNWERSQRLYVFAYRWGPMTWNEAVGIPFWLVYNVYSLGGGLKHVLSIPLLQEMIQFAWSFSKRLKPPTRFNSWDAGYLVALQQQVGNLWFRDSEGWFRGKAWEEDDGGVYVSSCAFYKATS